MPRSFSFGSLCRAAFAVTLAVTGASSHAAATSWKASTGGDWWTVANWTEGVPSSASAVAIANGAAVGIGSSLGVTAICGSLDVSSGNLTVTTSLGLRVLSSSVVGKTKGKTGEVFINAITNSLTPWYAGQLTIGDAGTGAVQMQGALVQGSSLRMGVQARSLGSLTISGPRAPYADFQAQAGASPTTVGENGSASVMVINGGLFTQSQGRLDVGSYQGGMGSILIDGASSELKVSGLTANVGVAGQGTLMVRNGGQATLGHLFIGSSNGSRGEVDVSGAQSVIRVTNVYLGPDGAGFLNVTAGGQFFGSQVLIGEKTGTGALLVSGAGSWAALGAVDIRNGALTIEKGAGTDAGIQLNSAAATLNIGDVRSGFSSTVSGEGPGTINFTNAQDLEFGGSIEGPHTINVLGGGTIRFLPNHDFSSGPLNVLRGTVVADFSDGQKTIVVGPGGVLAGPGGVAANVFVQGMVSPGDPADAGASSVFRAADLNFAPASTYRCELAPAGVAKGQLEVRKKLTFSANSYLPARIQLVTLGADGAPGPLPDFDPTKPCTWKVATVDGGIFGFDRESVVVDLTAFQNSHEGSFEVTEDGSDLEVLYLPPATPTPTPSPLPPTKPPVIAVDGRNTMTSAKASYVLAGDVRSSSPHVRVECRIGAGVYRRVGTDLHWRTRVSLRPGRNVFSFRAFDAEGRMSNVEKVIVVFKND